MVGTDACGLAETSTSAGATSPPTSATLSTEGAVDGAGGKVGSGGKSGSVDDATLASSLFTASNEGAAAIAEELRRLVEEFKFSFEGEHIPVTVSAGTAQLPEGGDVMQLQIKVNPETHVIEDAKFKCFGCGVGGDVFTFIQLRGRVDFREALRILAEKAGIDGDRFVGRFFRARH